MATRGAELAAQLASGSADARQAAYAELLAIEAAEHHLHANANSSRDIGAPKSLHVGGLDGPDLEDETALASIFGRFGTVLAVTLRVRHEVKNGKAVVSWALVSFSTEAEVEAALASSADLTAQYKDLVMRRVDEVQVANSTGAMGEVMRKHVLARETARRASQSTAELAQGIALACASPLCEVLCKDASEVGAEEYRRALLVLTALCSIDPVSVGGEITKPDKCNIYKVFVAPDSALGAVLAKEPSALTAEDALLIACVVSPPAVYFSSNSGTDGVNQEAGVTAMEYLGMMMPSMFLFTTSTPEDQRNLALVPLLLQLLREPHKLPEFALPGVIIATTWIEIGRPAVASKFLEQGAFGVFMDILRMVPPNELVATAGLSRRPHGYAFMSMKELIEGCQAAGTDLTTQLLSSGFVDMVVSAFTAVEQLGSHNVCAMTVVWSILRLLTIIDGEALEQVESKLRAVPSALRYVYENNITHLADFGLGSRTLMTMLAANLYGRDEDNTFGFEQQDIDAFMALDCEIMACKAWGGAFVMTKQQARGILNLCISDTAKPMLLRNSDFIAHLLDGLLLDPEHPRKDADEQIKAAVQRDFAECIQQIVLFGPGCEDLTGNPDVVRALETLVEHAWSEDAKSCARGALKQLCPERSPAVEVELPDARHIMMSYQWDVQSVVKRIVADLKRRKYMVWFDAELMLYGVSEKYKESGAQEDVDLKDYKAKGWLGLILGQSLWFAFYESAVDTDEKFMRAMDALVREIGDRGKIKTNSSTVSLKVAEGVPPKAPEASAATLEPAPEPAPEPASQPALSIAPVPPPPTAAATTTTSALPMPRNDHLVGRSAPEPQSFSSSMQNIQHMSLGSGTAAMPTTQPSNVVGSFSEIVSVFEKHQTQIQAIMDAKDAKMEQQINEMESRLQQLAPVAAISEEQLSQLQARLGVLHSAKLLSDDELYSLEDLLADWVEMQASMAGQIVTETMLYATAGHAFNVGLKVHKILKIGAVVSGDGAFARQLRRKFL